MTWLRLDGVALRRNGLTLIDMSQDQPVEVAERELLGVAGRAGSGKTILARLLVGLDTPDRGEIRLKNQAIELLPPEKRSVALVWPEERLMLDHSVEDNAALALRCRGVGTRERRTRIAEVLTILNLEGRAKTKCRELGPYQRWQVGLARAAALDPAVLVVDEPFDHRSETERDRAREELRRVHAELHSTTIVLSRRAGQLLALADRLAVLNVGRVVQVGTPVEVYARPANPEAAQLLGPGNLFPGQIESVDPRGTAVVRTQLGRLVGRARPGSLAVGDPATVCIRPESIALSPTGNIHSNRFVATVRRRVFLGSHCRIELQGAGDWTGTAVALPVAALGLREGQSLTVSIAPEWVSIFPNT